jgi:hypothetical protein
MIDKITDFLIDSFEIKEVPKVIKEDNIDLYKILMKFRKKTIITGWIFGPLLIFYYSYCFVNVIKSFFITIIYMIVTKIISKRWSLHETLLMILPPSTFLIILLAYPKLEEQKRIKLIKEIHES